MYVELFNDLKVGQPHVNFFKWRACEKKIIRCSFSPSLLEERALSQVNIGIKYDISLHAFPQLHHFLRDI